MTLSDSVFECLRLALVEERGELIVSLYELSCGELEQLVEAAQLIDSEGCEILEALNKEDDYDGTCDTASVLGEGRHSALEAATPPGRVSAPSSGDAARQDVPDSPLDGDLFKERFGSAMPPSARRSAK